MKKNKIYFLFILLLCFSYINYFQNELKQENNLDFSTNEYYIIDRLTAENKENIKNENLYRKYTVLDNQDNSQENEEFYNKNYIEKTIYYETYLENEIFNETHKDDSNSMNLSALSACLIDPNNNRVLYAKNSNEIMSMASTTKIMTCIIALENGNLNDKVKISKYAASMPQVKLGAKENDEFYLKDLLYSLMLESHNDIAVAIAEHIGGSIEKFAILMNKKAEELACINTNFVTPSGLDANTHKTTAVELAKIAAYAIKNEKFLDIINTPSWSFNSLNRNKTYTVHNKDRFLSMYEGAFGIKTGFTNKAGYCFVGAANRNNKVFISVVLGSGWPPYKNYKWKDTVALMNYGNNNYIKNNIFNYGKSFKAINIKNGQKDFIHVYHYDKINALIKKDEFVHIVYHLPKFIKAPIKTNEIVGRADYYINDYYIRSVPIKTIEESKEIDFKYCIYKILNLWKLL